MNGELGELKERIVRLTDQELLDMITGKPGDYRQEALDFAKTELKARGTDFANANTEEAQPEQESAEAEETQLDRRGSVPGCLVCGGPLRPGTLVAEKELTIVFADNHEERFVRVNACAQCGQLSLVADYNTEVQ